MPAFDEFFNDAGSGMERVLVQASLKAGCVWEVPGESVQEQVVVTLLELGSSSQNRVFLTLLSSRSLTLERLVVVVVLLDTEVFKVFTQN